MNISKCRAKNPATCRVHGSRGQLDIASGEFKGERSSLTEHKSKSDFFKLLITTEEAEAVKGYLDQDYTSINKLLHTGDSDPYQDYSMQMQKIDSAIAKYSKYQGEDKTVYRASKIYSDAPFTSLEEAQKAIAQKFVVGNTITFDGYTSTTENPEALFDFIPTGFDDIDPNRRSMFAPKTRAEHIKLEGDGSIRGIIYEIRTKDGAPVSTFGQTYEDKEQEFLLGRGKTFRIVDVVPYTKIVNPVKSHKGNQIHATVIRLLDEQ